MARPSFKPTVEQRKLVEKLAGIGCTAEEILYVVPWPNDTPIDEKTLRKHFRAELDRGIALGSSRLRGKLYDEAMNGNTACLIFMAKVRLGMKETVKIENTGADGAPLQPATVVLLPQKDATPIDAGSLPPRLAPPTPPAPTKPMPPSALAAASPPAPPEPPQPRAVGRVGAIGSMWPSAAKRF